MNMFTPGDNVLTLDHRHIGTVWKTHNRCPQSDEWLAKQTAPVEQYREEPWITVFVVGGGVVCVPELRATPIDEEAFVCCVEGCEEPVIAFRTYPDPPQGVCRVHCLDRFRDDEVLEGLDYDVDEEDTR